MEQTPSAEPEERGGDGAERPAAPAAARVQIEVSRTGGFAGLTRRWTVQPADDEAPRWLALIDRCPWDEISVDGKGVGAKPVPDGFVWRIRARGEGADAHDVELPDAALTGAWRELVDAVRSWKAPARGDHRS